METAKRIYRPDELQPSEPIHPGEMLRDELEARGMSQKKFAGLIGMPYTEFNEIVNGKRGSVSRSSVNVNPVPGDLPAGFFRLEPGIGRRIAERKCELSVRFALNRDFHAGDEFQMFLQFACGEFF